MVDAADFYDGLSSEYDCLFPDWWAAAQWHATVIGRVLAEEGVLPPSAILDCACGIGTQALPLAAMGYAVTGTDISTRAVQRARDEAAQRGIQLALAVVDMRAAREDARGRFAAVIACDNALPHLLSDDELLAALHNARTSLQPGGIFLASIRDYDTLAIERPTGVPITVHGCRGARHASGQAWTWPSAGDRVEITLFTLREREAGWETATHETTYRALQRDVLTHMLGRSGFDEPRWLTPRQSGYYQPIVLARAR